MKGVADRWTLEASLTNGPWLGGARDPDTMYLSTLLGAVDMVSKGCTACFDLVYEFPRPTAAGLAAVARAYADVGMRAVLAPMIADKTLFHAIPGLLDALPADLRDIVGKFDLGGGDDDHRGSRRHRRQSRQAADGHRCGDCADHSAPLLGAVSAPMPRDCRPPPFAHPHAHRQVAIAGAGRA